MKDWRMLSVGDKMLYHWNEFDGSGEFVGTVIAINKDHAIVEAIGMKLWLDDESQHMFQKLTINNQNISTAKNL